MTLRGGLSFAIIGLVFIQCSATGPRKRSWRSTWKCRQPRKLAVNSLSGKRGAAQVPMGVQAGFLGEPSCRSRPLRPNERHFRRRDRCIGGMVCLESAGTTRPLSPATSRNSRP